MIKSCGVIFKDRECVEFGSVEVPDPGPEDILMRTRFSWISNGTESSYLRGERLDGDLPWRSGDPAPFPIVPGYQKTGIVERVGKNVTTIEPGDWVFVPSSKVGAGFFHDHGGHVSHGVQAADMVWKLPEGLSPVAASGLLLLQVGYNCGMRAPLEEGDTALVIGDGQVGHWAVQTLISRGAKVILTGKTDDRLARFTPGPKGHTLNIRNTDLVKAVRELAPQGIRVLVDTVGSVQVMESYFQLLQRCAHVVTAGFCGTQGAIDIQRLRASELTLHAPAGMEKSRMDATLAMLAVGELDSESLITHRFPAQRAAEAYHLILTRTEPVLGVILEW